MAAGWNALVVSFYRGAVGLLFVLLWLAVRPHGSGLASGRMWLWSTIRGVGVAGNFAFNFVSFAEGIVAVAATLLYCAPVFVCLVSFALKLERPTPLKSIAMVMIGIAFFFDPISSGHVSGMDCRLSDMGHVQRIECERLQCVQDRSLKPLSSAAAMGRERSVGAAGIFESHSVELAADGRPATAAFWNLFRNVAPAASDCIATRPVCRLLDRQRQQSA